MFKKLRTHWTVRELVTIGIFAACAKVLSLFIALAGGGMNPVTLLLKNIVYTTLFMVMLYKVRKLGTISLFSFVSLMISLLYLGSGVMALPSTMLSALFAELAIYLTGGAKKKWAPVVGIAVLDLVSRCISVGLSYLVMRENPAIFFMVLPIILIGYLGAIIGLYTGVKAVKELRHAGIVRN